LSSCETTHARNPLEYYSFTYVGRSLLSFAGVMLSLARMHATVIQKNICVTYWPEQMRSPKPNAALGKIRPLDGSIATTWYSVPGGKTLDWEDVWVAKAVIGKLGTWLQRDSESSMAASVTSQIAIPPGLTMAVYRTVSCETAEQRKRQEGAVGVRSLAE
jgi:hypothetical protein